MGNVKDALISEITGMIQREGEGLLNDEGVDWEICKGVAEDIMSEIVQPLSVSNTELLEACKAACILLGMYEPLETQLERETINELVAVIKKARGGI
jgi:hypothetical protein